VSDLLDKLRPVAERLALFGAGPTPFDTTIDAVLSPTEAVIDGRRVLMFGSNNYLGLTHHAEVLEAAALAARAWGAGTTGSRVANGSLALHAALEADFAACFGKRHAKVFTTGHQANQSLLTALCGPDDVLFLDGESHASIHDGARLSGATVIAFRHNDAGDLAKKLARLPPGRNRLVVIEGLYSTSGDIAPVAAIAAVAKEHGAYLAVDEAHSFGVLGQEGLGAAEGIDVDFIVGTFSKALGGVGGFVVSDHAALRMLHFTARAYLFTASGSPATIAAARAALGVVRREPALRERLRHNVRRWRSGLADLGLTLGTFESPIVPIILGAPEPAVAMWRRLLAAGLYVNLVLPPGCPLARAGLRTSVSAAHDDAAVDRALSLVEEAR
jgi:8-amino-7-oxononanoate synthase